MTRAPAQAVARLATRVVAGMMLAACCAGSVAQDFGTPAVTRFVAPTARGTGDGSSERDAAGDLPHAVARALADPEVSELVLLPGRYVLTATLAMKPGPKRLVIRGRTAAPGGGGAILDGRGVVATGMFVNGSGLTIQGLTFRNFRENGVVMLGGERLKIKDNRFERIASTAWSQAAIHGVHYLVDVHISGNTIVDTGYSGILFEAGEDGRLSNIAIRDNRLARTCLTVGDCGAIYAQGRARQSGGFVITGNVIRDFGPAGAQAQGIYLDDGLSDVTVTGNDIAGTGEFAFHLHGGSDNRVSGNNVNACAAKGVLFYQDLGGERDARRMTGNLVRDNAVRLPGARRDAAVKLDLRRSSAVGLAGNRLTNCAR